MKRAVDATTTAKPDPTKIIHTMQKPFVEPIGNNMEHMVGVAAWLKYAKLCEILKPGPKYVCRIRAEPISNLLFVRDL